MGEGQQTFKYTNLEKLFRPQSVAVVGVSQNPTKGGGFIWSRMTGQGYSGQKFPIGRSIKEIDGIQCYESIREIEEPIDLAIIAVPAAVVETVLKECVQKQVPFVIIHTAGFAELGEEGLSLQKKILEPLQSSQTRVVGPNCMGLFCPDVSLNTIVEVEKSGISRSRSIVVSCDKRHRILTDPNESDLVNAVFRVATGSQPVVCFLQGHNEPDINDDGRNGYMGFVSALSKQGYLLRALTMAGNPVVPADASILVIAHPAVDISGAEFVAINDFLARGGALLLLLDPGAPQSMARLAASLNIKLGNDFLVSSSAANNQLGVDGRVQVVVEYPEHPINEGMAGLATFFPFSQTLLPVGGNPKGLRLRTILKSDTRSWGERDLESLTSGQVIFDDKVDVRGPLPFGVAIEIAREQYFNGTNFGAPVANAEIDSTLAGTMYETLLEKSKHKGNGVESIFTESATSRVVVIGDSDFASNSNINLYGNKDYLLNLTGWLAREKTLIAVRGSDPLSQPIVLTRSQERWLGWGAMAIWPLLVTLLSAVVVVRRRRD